MVFTHFMDVQYAHIKCFPLIFFAISHLFYLQSWEKTLIVKEMQSVVIFKQQYNSMQLFISSAFMFKKIIEYRKAKSKIEIYQYC